MNTHQVLTLGSPALEVLAEVAQRELLRRSTYFKDFPIRKPFSLLERGFRDESWGNDAGARMVRPLADGRLLDAWVEHEDPDARDSGGKRYTVNVRKDAEAEGVLLVEGECIADILSALDDFLFAAGEVLRNAGTPEEPHWICPCGNGPSDSGHGACDGLGAPMVDEHGAPAPCWDGVHLRCHGCRRVFRVDDGRVVWLASALPGGSPKGGAV